jgi:hypothetical protein
MRVFRRASLLASLVICGFSLHAQDQSVHLPAESKASHTTASFAELPLVFEPNLGQESSDEAFLTRSGAMQFGFSPVL